MAVHLYRVILPVADLDQARDWYERMLDVRGEAVSAGRYYINCGGTVLALYDPQREDSRASKPNPEHIYFAVPDVDAVFQRVQQSGVESDPTIRTWPWGERSFYALDPSGNPVCFVDADTAFMGGAFVE